MKKFSDNIILILMVIITIFLIFMGIPLILLFNLLTSEMKDILKQTTINKIIDIIKKIK